MIFNIPDPTESWSNALTARSKAWAKRLDSIDTSQSDGFAFVGQFRSLGATEEAPVGTFYMVYYHQCRGSGKMDSRDVDLYKVTDNPEKPLVFVEGWNCGTANGWALRIRDEVAAEMAKASAPDHDALRKERAQLCERIAEIDKILTDG